VNWQIRVGEQAVIGVRGAIDIVCGRLEYIAANGSRCNVQRLLGEATEYARLLRQWARDNEPRPEPPPRIDPMDFVGPRPGGKPGPMSDG